MAELDHWHPLLRSAELAGDPVGVVVAGRELVLFRGEGRVGALTDRCPHRGMRLSRGRVLAGCLECPYHGWSFAPDGAGRSPGTPRLEARAEAYDVVERFGAVWVKAADAEARFPDQGAQGMYLVQVLRHRVEAPLELVLDNFTEVEHTGQVHALFGYATERMHEVETRVEANVDGVRVFNRGPQRRLPPGLGRLLGVRRDDVFIDDWTTRFSPVHVVYDHYWMDPESGERRPTWLRVAVFLNPLDADRTDLITFVHVNEAPRLRRPHGGLLSRLLMRFVDREIRLDVVALEGLADKRTDLRGMKLSRFDKVLGEHRRRIAEEYRG